MLIRPLALNKVAFDSSSAEVFEFSVSSGDKVVANELTIRNNVTNEIVYQSYKESFIFSQEVPADTLINGVYYNYYFITYNESGDESQASNVVPFYCYTTPTVSFTNLPLNNIVTNSSYDFYLNYEQIEGEKLDFVRIDLYDAFQTIVSSSGNLYNTNTPPLTFNYMFSGLIDNNIYYIEASGTTINGTIFTSGKIQVVVNYIRPTLFSILDIDNKCDEGYVQLISNIVPIDGEGYGEYSFYDDGTDIFLDVSSDDSYVQFSEGFSSPLDFTLMTWMKFNYFGNLIEMWSDENTKSGFILSLNRYVIDDESKEMDCLELFGFDNGVLKVYKRSNFVDLLNNHTYAFVWLRKVGNTYDLRLTPMERTANVVEWNDISNIKYNKITDFPYSEQGFIFDAYDTELALDISAIQKINSIRLKNGYYDQLYMTEDVTSSFSDIKSSWNWDYNTIISCDFDNNINGGNVDIILEQIDAIRIKRRAVGDFNWVTIYEKKTETTDDFNIIISDVTVPRGSFEYAIVPVLEGTIEGEYITTETEIYWNGVYVSTPTKTMKFLSEVSYSGFNRVKEIGTQQPVESVYPTIVQKGNANYTIGTITGMLNGYNHNHVEGLNKVEVVKQTNEYLDILASGDSVCIKDWNGNVWLGSVTNVGTTTYDKSFSNGRCSITFSFAEQGKYNVQKDLYNLGFTDVLL